MKGGETLAYCLDFFLCLYATNDIECSNPSIHTQAVKPKANKNKANTRERNTHNNNDNNNNNTREELG